MPQLAKSAFNTDWVTCLPEAARIIFGHVAGRSADPTVGGTPPSAPEMPDHDSGDNSVNENVQTGWGPMPGDQEPDD